MAKFYGTIDEYHKLVGPRIRNVIQARTKKRKKELGSICQHCHKRKELEAAHVRGKSRKSIIGGILEKYLVNKEKRLVEIDLVEVEKEILEAHQPIDRYFKFLCSKCHSKYDAD